VKTNYFSKFNFLDAIRIIIFLSSIAIISLFFNFTADDAYIYMRYAFNLIESGALVYNIGEQINALTSPFLAFLDALLYVLFTDITLSLKILSISTLFLSAILILKKFKGKKHSQLIVLSMMVLSPCVLLWSIGGLDTMFTLFFATILTLLAYKEKQISDRTLFAVCFLAGLLFFTRYDSVLFTIPLVLHSFVKSRNIKKSAIAVIIGLIIPCSWIFGAFIYYGDIFPTSLYVKGPQFNIHITIYNALYILQYLFFISAIPFILLFCFSVRSRKIISYIFQDQFFQYWGLYIGIILLLIYGLSVATTHMMFSFRYFVPYIPALSIIIADLFAQYDRNINEKQFAALVVFVILFQIFQAFYTYQFSINGFVLNGEFRNYSIKTDNKVVKNAKKTVYYIKEHWNKLPISKVRPPRIYTRGEGLIPFNYREAYIYGILVSYRHYCNPDRKYLMSYSDYIIQYVHSGEGENKPGNFLVVFNPKPYDNILPDKINIPCPLLGNRNTKTEAPLKPQR